MPQFRGRLDCYFNPTADGSSTASRAGGEMYVNLIQLLSSSGPALGIEMLSANYGVGGTGWNFWNSSNLPGGTPGPRSWACFRFHSASAGKFDMLVYQLTGAFGTTYGSSIVIDSSTTAGSGPAAVGVAFASHPSGSNVSQSDGPWNGTYSQTSGSVGNPVWKLNSNQKGAFFPRQNGISGIQSASRGAMIAIASTNNNNTIPYRHSFVISEDSFASIRHPTNGDLDRVIYFGPYVPRSGSTPYPESPYFFYSNQDANGTSAIRNFYGTATANGTSNPINSSIEGALSVPDLISGSRSFSFVTLSGVDQTMGFNMFLTSSTAPNGTYTNLPLWVCLNESPALGILGKAKYITCGVGMSANTVSPNSGSTAIGRIGIINEVKLIMPWSGVPIADGGFNRTGNSVSFSR